MQADAIADYLEDQNFGTGGTDLFVGQYPAGAPDEATCLGEYPGAEEVRTFGHGIVKPGRLQVLCRAADYETAQDNAEAVYGLLNAKADLMVSGGPTFMWIKALHLPFKLNEDANGRTTVACNYELLERV